VRTSAQEDPRADRIGVHAMASSGDFTRGSRKLARDVRTTVRISVHGSPSRRRRHCCLMSGVLSRRNAGGIMTAVHERTEGARCAWTTTREDVQEHLRQARRAVTDARHASEDAVGGVALQIRRHPLTAVSAAAGAGIVVGGVLGLALGRFANGHSAVPRDRL
jgi:ElaB/YqjD/DUF883 family membrane-anchored ribosome-binding protein